ncbi:pyridoxal phosphate-dependent aminotransferase [Acinetobacter baumannii]|jgi:aspartate aminotransferase|uniref:pyridoxal phosphate-dependent aminotransferase n=1 Tax=Acinetobacter calcoaceticus/baumannii complex TaxID=909768 RepID=UPI003859884B
MSKFQQLNRYLAEAKPSATYKMIDRVAEKRTSGAKIISLSAGEPDFDTPEHVRQSAKDAIDAGFTRYTQVAGLRQLREAIAEKFQKENDLKNVTWKQTIVCSGGKQVLYNALAATLNEGDEVIIPAPYWVSYPEMVQLSGAIPVIVPCSEKHGFKLTPVQLDEAITPQTRWVILNSPSNPTGAVYSKDELQALADILLKHPHVLILSDDIYEHLIFDGQKFNTIAQVEPRLIDRTLTMNGVSKAYAMTGWRIGFATGPQWLLDAMEKLQGQQTSGASSISQYAAMAALSGSQDFVRNTNKVFEKRRDMMVQLLNDTPYLSCLKPEGAFYAFVNCAELIGRTSQSGVKLNTDEDVALALLDEANIAVVQGSAFGLAPYFRIAYALDDESLQVACNAIKEFCVNTTL